MNNKEQLNIVKEFAEKLIDSQKDTPPEFEATFRKNYRKLFARFDENGIPTPEPIATRCIGCGGINISSKDKVKPFCNICLMLGRGYNE